MTPRLLEEPIFRCWRADMAEARAALAEGDRQMFFICMGRARVARGWIRDDLAQYRRQFGIGLFLRHAPPEPADPPGYVRTHSGKTHYKPGTLAGAAEERRRKEAAASRRKARRRRKH